MGHTIDYYTNKASSEKSLKRFIDSVTAHAYDPRETSSYHGHMTIHRDKVYQTYDEAMQAIKSFDNGCKPSGYDIAPCSSDIYQYHLPSSPIGTAAPEIYHILLMIFP